MLDSLEKKVFGAISMVSQFLEMCAESQDRRCGLVEAKGYVTLKSEATESVHSYPYLFICCSRMRKGYVEDRSNKEKDREAGDEMLQ